MRLLCYRRELNPRTRNLWSFDPEIAAKSRANLKNPQEGNKSSSLNDRTRPILQVSLCNIPKFRPSEHQVAGTRANLLWGFRGRLRAPARRRTSWASGRRRTTPAASGTAGRGDAAPPRAPGASAREGPAPRCRTVCSTRATWRCYGPRGSRQTDGDRPALVRPSHPDGPGH